jgi:hypothetical protein
MYNLNLCYPDVKYNLTGVCMAPGCSFSLMDTTALPSVNIGMAITASYISFGPKTVHTSLASCPATTVTTATTVTQPHQSRQLRQLASSASCHCYPTTPVSPVTPVSQLAS